MMATRDTRPGWRTIFIVDRLCRPTAAHDIHTKYLAAFDRATGHLTRSAAYP
jgi:hypothetical protein